MPGHRERSDHFDGRRFFNPSGANGQPFYQVPRMLMTRGTKWPVNIEICEQVPPIRQGDEVILTWIGHATFLLQTPAGNLLTDPVYSDRASPIGFAGPRRARPPAVRFEDLPRIDVVLVSHCHYDHCDLTALTAIERRWQPLVVTPLENGDLLRSAGVDHIEELDWFEASRAAPMSIVATPAQHFSARSPFDRNLRLWAGFLIEVAGVRIFFAADSGYGPHFGEIARRLGPSDVALLPIGAYEPRWFMKDVHMNPAEAVRAHEDLGARMSIAMHFGTFQLTAEGIDEPVEALERARRERRLGPETFRVLDFGASLRLGRAEMGTG